MEDQLPGGDNCLEYIHGRAKCIEGCSGPPLPYDIRSKTENLRRVMGRVLGTHKVSRDP